MARLSLFKFALLLCLAAFSASEVQALKCSGVPGLDHETIEQSPFIFGGRLERTRDLTEEERAAAKGVADAESPAADQNDQVFDAGLKIYEYKVIHNWKGMKRDARVNVLFNAHWGDTLNFGQDALIVAETQVGNMLWVPLCGPSSAISDAEDSGIIGTLREVIGIGYDVKIPGADRICHSADDCTAVSTRCGGCDCGMPIAISAVKKHQGRLSASCGEPAENAHVCESPECRPYRPSCIEGQCQ